MTNGSLTHVRTPCTPSPEPVSLFLKEKAGGTYAPGLAPAVAVDGVEQRGAQGERRGGVERVADDGHAAVASEEELEALDERLVRAAVEAVVVGLRRVDRVHELAGGGGLVPSRALGADAALVEAGRDAVLAGEERLDRGEDRAVRRRDGAAAVGGRGRRAIGGKQQEQVVDADDCADSGRAAVSPRSGRGQGRAGRRRGVHTAVSVDVPLHIARVHIAFAAEGR